MPMQRPADNSSDSRVRERAETSCTRPAAAWVRSRSPGCSSTRQSRGSAGSRGPQSPRPPHFPAKARSVIYLFMHGGPSHLETFDPKPDLQRLAGQPLPASFGAVATRRKVAHNPLLATKRTFRKCGQSGIEISDFLPHLVRLCRRPRGDPFVLGRQRQPSSGCLRDEHRLDPDGQAEPRELGQLRTGNREPGPARPSSSCPTRAAGSRAARRPMVPGFLPASHQGTLMRGGDRPILDLLPPDEIAHRKPARGAST